MSRRPIRSVATEASKPARDAGFELARPSCADGRGTLVSMFFSSDVSDIARAKAICRRCALVEPCLRAALERNEPCGVWGGQLLEAGRIIHHKRPPGRPRRPRRPPPAVDAAVAIGPGGESRSADQRGVAAGWRSKLVWTTPMI